MSTATKNVRQLVILSGKGGTGKTSVVAALATLAGHKVLADCDVDAADLHLVLEPTLRKTEKFTSGKEASIITDRCGACGICEDYCRFDAVRLVQQHGAESTYQIDPIACEGCGLCARVCTFGAVEMSEAERGKWFVSDTNHGPLVHACLNLGGENSGKLVTIVKDEAMKVAEETGADLVIVDGPPGIGCPVIASVTGADLILAVTEPTVSAAHDLERLATLVQSFKLPLAICINKSDINPDMSGQIRETCAKRGLPVLGELAYDTAVVEAQVQGKSIMEYGDSPVAEQIPRMWQAIAEILK